MSATDLRSRRQLYRTTADELAKQPGHDPHRGTLKARSVRPLVKVLDESALPAIRAGRSTPLGWPVFAATLFPPDAKPIFPNYLRKLNGTPVALTGYIQPAGDDPNPRGFLLLEYPVGCWFCETPGPTGLVSVEVKPGSRFEFKRGLVKITGILVLNADDPEDFLFRITGAVVGESE